MSLGWSEAGWFERLSMPACTSSRPRHVCAVSPNDDWVVRDRCNCMPISPSCTTASGRSGVLYCCAEDCPSTPAASTPTSTREKPTSPIEPSPPSVDKTNGNGNGEEEGSWLSRNSMWIFGGVTLVAAIGIGAYLWNLGQRREALIRRIEGA